VAKEIGRRWKAMDDKEKDALKAEADSLNAEAQRAWDAAHPTGGGGADGAEQGADGGGDDDGENGGKGGGGPPELGGVIPASMFKKIAKLDDALDNIGGDACAAGAALTELVATRLALRAAREAQGHSRRTVQPTDLAAVAKEDRERGGMFWFLDDVLADDVLPRLNAKRAAVTEAKKEKATKKGRSDVGGGGAEEE